MPLSIALLHHPMTNKRHDVVTTSITNFDIHDLARSAMTFGVQRYFVVHPVAAQRHFASRILAHWREGWGAEYNVTRKEALMGVRLAADLGEVADALEAESGGIAAQFVATTAKRFPRALAHRDFRRMLEENPDTPYCMIFGTGWGLHSMVFEEMDHVLAPISGAGDWNHLSVRSAAAILLDRLIGRPLESPQP